MTDFFISNQIYKTEEVGDTFLVPEHLVKRCMEYANNLLIVRGEEQITLSPMDLACDELECDKKFKKKYKFDKKKYEIKHPEYELSEEALIFLQRFGWSWYNALRDIIKTDQFQDNLSDINDLRDTKTIYPTKENIFRAFRETNFDAVTVVCLAQDPYPNKNIKGIPYANGIAFATETEDKPYSLKAIEEAIKKEMNYPENFVLQNDLQHLVKQGVLLLNSSLTVEAKSPGIHSVYWSDFIKFVIRQLGQRERPVIFILFGSVAKGFKQYINSSKDFVFATSHPASAAYSESIWDSQGVFKAASDKHNELFNRGIKWII